jgi:hypothetical protein
MREKKKNLVGPFFCLNKEKNKGEAKDKERKKEESMVLKKNTW